MLSLDRYWVGIEICCIGAWHNSLVMIAVAVAIVQEGIVVIGIDRIDVFWQVLVIVGIVVMLC